MSRNTKTRADRRAGASRKWDTPGYWLARERRRRVLAAEAGRRRADARQQREAEQEWQVWDAAVDAGEMPAPHGDEWVYSTLLRLGMARDAAAEATPKVAAHVRRAKAREGRG